MKQQSNHGNCNVYMNADGIYIEGKSRIVLCASVFYFRIPRSEWRDRLEKVKAAGYNCVDIYFPWNYHEMEEGCWDFDGEKDVDFYLSLAAELGLWVIARPGPYICSEWDMGGLPAYLLTKNRLELRDYNEIYLGFVKKWYDKIMPTIAKYQIGKQGSVIAVQIENELDFFDCKQIEPYIARLRDYALEEGIEVPLVVCSGQCDIVRAGGMVDGVIPTMNFYPDLQEKSLEDRLHHYASVFREQDLPFCITETSPVHVILRREFASGAKFIAPYNQVSGTDFGFTTSVNNWGSPLAFMTHDYNLKGMVDPQGRLTPEYGEAYLFAGLIRTFEESLEGAVCLEENELSVRGDCTLSNGIHRTLHMKNGSRLLPLANVDSIPGKVQFTYGGKCRPMHTELTVNPLTCPMIPFDVPLSGFEDKTAQGRLAYSTAELVHSAKAEKASHLLFYTEDQAELAFILPEGTEVKCEHMEKFQDDELTILTFESNMAAKAELTFPGGEQIVIYGLSKEEAIKQLADHNFSWEKKDAKLIAEEESKKKVNEEQASREELLGTLENIQYRIHLLKDMGQELGGQELTRQKGCPAMEDMNYARGYGWYEGETRLDTKQKALGYMIYDGMDIIHLYRNHQYMHSLIGDGCHQFIKESEELTVQSITLGVRSEIWGHSNFSDSRVPSMNIKNKKGIRGLSVVTAIEDITENWCYCKDEIPLTETALLTDQDNFRPFIMFGNYNNPEQPQVGVYKKRIKAVPGCDSVVLQLKEFHSLGRVYLDGRFVKTIQPMDSTVTLDQVSGKQEFELAIYLEMKTIQESIQAKLCLYYGKHATDITFQGADEKDINSYLENIQAAHLADHEAVRLQDICFGPGETALLTGSFHLPSGDKQSLCMKIKGRDAKVLVILNGILLGRLWLPSEHTRPFFKGGSDEIIYLPAGFLKEDNRLELFVEGIEGKPWINKAEFEIICNEML